MREAACCAGHAVRANYLGRRRGGRRRRDADDRELLDAVIRQWQATVARRTYLTGGQGSQHQDEAFGEDLDAAARPRLLRDLRRASRR